MTHIIKVTNNGADEIRDYFNGIPYVFACGEPVNVPLDAVEHIFGMEYPADEALMKTAAWRDQAFAAVSKRWGWNSHDKEKLAENRKAFNKLIFAPIEIKMVEVVAKNDVLATPREQKNPVPANFKPKEASGEED